MVRTRVGPLSLLDRLTPFSQVSCVRVTLLGPGRAESSVCIVSNGEELELPPTNTPRQEALLLAMTMGVQLVKIYGNGTFSGASERIARLYRNEDAI
jgi:hypothetical protein